MSKLHFTIPEEQCGCILFLRELSAPYFSGLWMKNSAISPKVFQQVCENCTFCVQRNIFDQKIFYRIIKSYSYSGYELIFFGVSAKGFWRGCNNCILQVHRKFLCKKLFTKNHCFIFNFGQFKKIFHLSSGICINVVIYAVHVSKMKVSGRKFPPEFFWIRLFIRTLSGKVSAFRQKSFRRVVKILFYLPRGSILRNKYYTEKKIVLWIFPDFDRNCSGVILKHLRRSSGHAFFFQIVFLGNKYFLKSYEFLNPFGVSEETSVEVTKTCILTALEINFEEKCWLGKVLILIVFGHWAKIFCPDSNVFLARKRNFHCTCAEDRFWVTLFQKKVLSTFFSEFVQKISKRPAKLIRRNCKSCILRFQRNNVGV